MLVQPVITSQSDGDKRNRPTLVLAPVSTSPITPVLCALLFSFPLVYCVYLISTSAGLPNFDYYHNLMSIFDVDGNFLWRGLFVPGNEHYIVIAKTIYALNVAWFSGHNFGLGLSAVGLALILSFFLWKEAAPGLRDSWTRVIFAGVLSALVFSLHATHNFVWGMSGPIWFSSLLMAILAFRSRSIAAQCAFALMASLCNGPGLAVWPALVALHCIKKSFARAMVMTSITGLVFVLYVKFFYIVPFHHAAPQFDPVAICYLVLTFLGGALTRDPTLSFYFGAVGLSLFAVVLTQKIQEKNATPVFWLVLPLYIALVAIMISVARGSFDSLEVVISGRYAALPSLFWLSLFFVALSNLTHHWIKPAVVAICLSGFFAGYPEVQRFKQMKFDQELSGLAVRLGSPPLDSYQLATLTSDSREKLVKTLKSLSHYPFVGDFSVGCGRIGTVVAPVPREARLGKAIGALELFHPAGASSLTTVTGWALGQSASVECIVAVDETGLIIGAAFYGRRRTDVSLALLVPDSNTGWQGLVKASDMSKVSFLVKLLDDPAYYELDKSI